MPLLPLDLDAHSLDDLKRLITELLVRVAALEDDNKALCAENARLKALPPRPKLAPGGMDKATEPKKRATAKAGRGHKRKVRDCQEFRVRTGIGFDDKINSISAR